MQIRRRFGGKYPNPAFSRMTGRDAARAARASRKLTNAPPAVPAISRGPSTKFLVKVLLERQRIVPCRALLQLIRMRSPRRPWPTSHRRERQQIARTYGAAFTARACLIVN